MIAKSEPAIQRVQN